MAIVVLLILYLAVYSLIKFIKKISENYINIFIDY